MKRDNFIRGIIMGALLAVLLVWLLIRPTTSLPRNPSALTATAKVAAPPSGKTDATRQIPALAVAPPALQPAPVPSPAQAAAESANDPQAHLATTISDIARLYRESDMLTIYQTYIPPDKVDPQRIEEYMDQMRNSTPESQESMRQRVYEPTAEALDALATQTPVYNDAGDEATYQFKYYNTNELRPLTFIKINGRWYIKPGSGSAN